MDTYTILWDFGDTHSASDNLTPSHTYPDNGIYTVTLTVTDDDGGIGEAVIYVTVQNVAPSVDAGLDQTVFEGDVVTFTGSFTDPCILDTHTIVWDFGDSHTVSGTLTPEHSYCDNGVYLVTLTITDDDGGVGTDTMLVTVTNVAPTVGPITATLDPVAIGTNIQVAADFIDPGCDVHTAIWDWGDDTASDGAIDGRSVTGSHTYTKTGVYALALTVTDDDGDIGTSVFEYVVVYDPDGGFVTGGGWMDSPEGAYTADPLLTGKANFGFVSKYKQGASVPTGETEFVFHVADLNFHSDSYDWLVIAGQKAIYKGIGTINGEGAYTFLLSAIDGNLPGGSDVDTFRIKIWTEDEYGNESVVYDNLVMEDPPDDAEPTTELGGGNIKIHKG